jgi:hypothetical protein
VRVIAFTITTFLLCKLLEDRFPHVDEVWLVAVLLAFLLTPPVRPVAKPNRLKWRIVYASVIIGMYLIAFKLPHLFEGFVNYSLASFILLVLYTAICWFITKRWRSVSVDEG